jgi:hypothetical protein
VVRRVAPFVLVHDHAAALGTHHDLVLGFLEVLHIDQPLVAASGEQCRFVDQIGQIGTRKSGRSTGDDVCLDIRR